MNDAYARGYMQGYMSKAAEAGYDYQPQPMPEPWPYQTPKLPFPPPTREDVDQANEGLRKWEEWQRMLQAKPAPPPPPPPPPVGKSTTAAPEQLVTEPRFDTKTRGRYGNNDPWTRMLEGRYTPGKQDPEQKKK